MTKIIHHDMVEPVYKGGGAIGNSGIESGTGVTNTSGAGVEDLPGLHILQLWAPSAVEPD